MCRRQQHDGVAIGGSLGGLVGGKVAAGAGAGLGNDRLAQTFGQLLAQDTRDDIGISAGGKALQEADGPARIVLGRERRCGEHARGCGHEGENPAFHVIPGGLERQTSDAILAPPIA